MSLVLLKQVLKFYVWSAFVKIMAMFRKFNASTIILTLSEPKLKILQRIVIGKNRKLKKN